MARAARRTAFNPNAPAFRPNSNCIQALPYLAPNFTNWLKGWKQVAAEECHSEVAATLWLEQRGVQVVAHHALVTLGMGLNALGFPSDEEVRATITPLPGGRARARIFEPAKGKGA